MPRSARPFAGPDAPSVGARPVPPPPLDHVTQRLVETLDVAERQELLADLYGLGVSEDAVAELAERLERHADYPGLGPATDTARALLNGTHPNSR